MPSSSSGAPSETAWDPNGSVCDLLNPVGEDIMGAEPVPHAGGSVAGQCVVPFQSTGDGPTPKLTLARVQDSVSGQIDSLRQGIADLEVSPAAGPTPGAKFAFATGSPDMEMLFWTGADGNTWKLMVEAAQPKTRKAQMLAAAKKINARLG